MIVVIVVLSATVTHKANEADQHRAVAALGLTLSGCKVIFVFTTAQYVLIDTVLCRLYRKATVNYGSPGLKITVR